MKILHKGTHVFDFSGMLSLAAAQAHVAGLIEEGFDPAQIERVPVTPEETRALIREGIAASAGDTLSLLGTASDGAQLLLYHMAKMTQGLAAANSLAEVREATAEFAPLADAFMAKVAAGEVKLPFKLKGEAAVMAEIEARATAVADALIHAQKGG